MNKGQMALAAVLYTAAAVLGYKAFKDGVNGAATSIAAILSSEQ